MCQIYNEIGCLTKIKSHLKQHKGDVFDTLEEIITFQKNYHITRRNIVLHHSQLIIEEKELLAEEISQLNAFIDLKINEIKDEAKSKTDEIRNRLAYVVAPKDAYVQNFINYFRKAFFKCLISLNEAIYGYRINRFVLNQKQMTKDKSSRSKYLNDFFDEAVNESGKIELQRVDLNKLIIDDVNNSIIGAKGEEMVVNKLQTLSDDYILINDFNCWFDNAIYLHSDRSYIKSIQIDHLLISPAGIFLIETKNWSEHSLQNEDFHSPISQIRRLNYALYKILVQETDKNNFFMRGHHWGQRKIPIKNVIVMVNKLPKAEFEYVKILTPDRLLNYIEYFSPSFSSEDVQSIGNRLLGICGK